MKKDGKDGREGKEGKEGKVGKEGKDGETAVCPSLDTPTLPLFFMPRRA
jgi:hypothetical protein